MRIVKVSPKGQITLPSHMRNILNLKAYDKIEVNIRDGEIILKPIPSFRSLRGSISPKKGSARKAMKQAVSMHIAEI